MKKNSEKSWGDKSIKLKFWFFKHCWWIIPGTLVSMVIYLLLMEHQIKNLITILGSMLSLLYFLQKQKLEELKVFRSLFKEFNKRYDRMNEEISRIVAKNGEALTPNEKAMLVDYFNLCAEEYLYYSKGYIDPKVWQAWYNGMKANLACARISEFWVVEKKIDSYFT